MELTIHLTIFPNFCLQRLRVVDVEDTGIEDGKFQKGKLFLYQELVGIERSGVGEASPSMARTPPQCAICLVEYQQEDDICWSHNKRCNHHFHRLCMIEWLSDHNECPCCRNNYLALSDDEEKEEGSDTSLPESISLFSHFDPPISPSESSEDPYVIDGLLLDQLAATDMRIPDLEVCLRPDNVSAATLSSAGSVYTERDSWISDEDVVEVALGDENATDDWSCPSVPDLTGPVNVDEYHAPRRRRTLQQAGSLQQSRQDIKDDQIVSLQLDDLIVDGLMRRLDEKEGGRCGGPRNEDGSESSGSVYTKGSYGDVGTTINKTNSISRHSSVDDTHTCAVCRKQYEVNEQVCWSTDPPCDHVFHRECLNKWIADDHTHCPFCNAKEVGFSAKVALPCVKEGSNFSLDGKYAFSGTTDSDVESQERSIF